MIEHIQSWIQNPANYLLTTAILQCILLFGLYFTQFNFRSLIKILDMSNKNNADMISLNGSIHANESEAISECKRLMQVNWKLKRRLEQYESIYGSLNTES